MSSQNWVLGAVLAVLLAGLVLAVGGPAWAVGLGLVAALERSPSGRAVAVRIGSPHDARIMAAQRLLLPIAFICQKGLPEQARQPGTV